MGNNFHIPMINAHLRRNYLETYMISSFNIHCSYDLGLYSIIYFNNQMISCSWKTNNREKYNTCPNGSNLIQF